MYKNILNLDYDTSKLINIGKEVPWQEQCMLTELMVKYIPKHITRMIPEGNGLSVEWDSEESFKNLLQEELYFAVLEILSRYDVSVSWS
jgi:thiamine biosynthesis protein ThiC